MEMNVFMAKFPIISLMVISFVIMLRDFFSMLRYVPKLFHRFICSNVEYYEKQLCILDLMVAAKAMLLNKRTNYAAVADDGGDHQTQNELGRFDAKKDNKMCLGDVKRVIMEELVLLESDETTTFCGEEEGDYEEDHGEEVNREELREAFGVFDENKDGFIDAREVKRVLHELGFMEPSEAECQSMIRTFDKNQDGKINFEEFVEIIEADTFH
ncbi:probable calcium-binding protein CML45 [Humulus lupulus]|uniref:probable calcium-binding protein CML45 n=1 Tax=Humulus lupulus TaxID=3486 RepID=UPI002B4114CD|nr:probable calcium-binding protein CML45 [Humulus lupulus]